MACIERLGLVRGFGLGQPLVQVEHPSHQFDHLFMPHVVVQRAGFRRRSPSWRPVADLDMHEDIGAKTVELMPERVDAPWVAASGLAFL